MLLQRGIGERGLDHPLTVVEAAGHAQCLHVVAEAAELMCLTRRDQAVGIQDHHLDAGLTMKRGGHRRTGIAGSGDENGERSFVCARKTAHAGGEEARADILERGSGAVEQLKHVPVVLWQRA